MHTLCRKAHSQTDTMLPVPYTGKFFPAWNSPRNPAVLPWYGKCDRQFSFGFASPNKISAMAAPPLAPGYQPCTIASTCSSAQFTASALPDSRTKITGLPQDTAASKISSCSPGRFRSGLSPLPYSLPASPLLPQCPRQVPALRQPHHSPCIRQVLLTCGHFPVPDCWCGPYKDGSPPNRAPSHRRRHNLQSL